MSPTFMVNAQIPSCIRRCTLPQDLSPMTLALVCKTTCNISSIMFDTNTVNLTDEYAWYAIYACYAIYA